MKEIGSNTYEALIDHLFSDDLFDTNLPMTSLPVLLPEESTQVQSFHADDHHDENGTNHKSATNQKPGKIAAYLKKECRPWLKQKPFSDQANFGADEEAKQKPKLESPALKKKQRNKESRALYREVMEEVANKTREPFLKHYGDDSVHVQFQELWKLKMKNKKVKLGRLTGNFPPASVATTPLHDLNPPCQRGKERGIGTFTQEKDPQLCQSPLQTTTSIPFPGQSIQFGCLQAYQDSNGRASKSAAYRKLRKFGSCKQQPGRPSLRNAGFEEANPIKFKLRRPAKKQQLHQPWLKQKPFDNQDNAAYFYLGEPKWIHPSTR